MSSFPVNTAASAGLSLASAAPTAGIPVLGPALAVGMGIFSFFGTRARNKAFEAANMRLQKRMTDEQASRRVSYLMNADSLSKLAQREIASSSLTIAEGQSANEFLASYVGQTYLSRAASKRHTEEEIRAIQTQKEEIANRYQTSSPFLAALTGAASGFGTGIQLSDAFSRIPVIRQAAAIQNSIGSLQLQRAAIALGGLDAMRSIALGYRDRLSSQVSLLGSSVQALTQ